MTATVLTLARRRRDELVQRVRQADDVADVFAIASTRLRRVVPFDAAAWSVTDPATGLPTGPTRIDGLEGMSAAQCSEHWRREFVDEDVNRFVDLARSPRPTAALRAVAGDPRRSARFRTMLAPLGYDDELRAVLQVGDSPWGIVTLWRRAGQPAFSPEATELVAGLSAPIADTLRALARVGESGGGAVPDLPGMLVFDRAGGLVSADDRAAAWLAELPDDRGFATDHGVEVPLWLVVTVLRAAAVAHGRGDGTARTRVRSRRGRWLVCHASCLRGADGTFSSTVVVIEPAGPAEIAPLVVEAYGFTGREQQITRLIARGANTAEIAEELYLSAHTVRGYVKAIFHKVEVSSRGELVAKLFAEHFEPVHRDRVTRFTAG